MSNLLISSSALVCGLKSLSAQHSKTTQVLKKNERIDDREKLENEKSKKMKIIVT